MCSLYGGPTSGPSGPGERGGANTNDCDFHLPRQIIFYEDRNFGGRHHECTSDCADLHSAFDRCRSVRVESGVFVVYDRPGYTGTQHLMRRGEYSDYTGMTGMTDCVRSCRVIPAVRLSVTRRKITHTYLYIINHTNVFSDFNSN